VEFPPPLEEGAPGGLVGRMRWTIDKSRYVVTMTSLTTALAFACNLSSQIAPIRLFGAFMTTLALCNYWLTCTTFPALIILQHRWAHQLVRMWRWLAGSAWKVLHPAAAACLRLSATGNTYTGPEAMAAVAASVSGTAAAAAADAKPGTEETAAGWAVDGAETAAVVAAMAAVMGAEATVAAASAASVARTRRLNRAARVSFGEDVTRGGDIALDAASITRTRTPSVRAAHRRTKSVMTGGAVAEAYRYTMGKQSEAALEEVLSPSSSDGAFEDMLSPSSSESSLDCSALTKPLLRKPRTHRRCVSLNDWHCLPTRSLAEPRMSATFLSAKFIGAAAAGVVVVTGLGRGGGGADHATPFETVIPFDDDEEKDGQVQGGDREDFDEVLGLSSSDDGGGGGGSGGGNGLLSYLRRRYRRHAHISRSGLAMQIVADVVIRFRWAIVVGRCRLTPG